MISKYLNPKANLGEIPPVSALINSQSDDEWMMFPKSSTYWVWRDDVFANDEIQKIIHIGKLANLDRARTAASTLEQTLKVRQSLVSWLPINDYTSWIYQKISTATDEVNKSWFGYDLKKIERLQFTCYDSSEYGRYDAHVDPNVWNKDTNRKLSFVMQLSDPEDYEGGDLCLYHSSKDPEIIPKKKGYCIFFPSHILHEVTPVTSGIRYTLVGWIHGPNFK